MTLKMIQTMATSNGLTLDVAVTEDHVRLIDKMIRPANGFSVTDSEQLMSSGISIDDISGCPEPCIVIPGLIGEVGEIRCAPPVTDHDLGRVAIQPFRVVRHVDGVGTVASDTAEATDALVPISTVALIPFTVLEPCDLPGEESAAEQRAP